MAAIQAADWAFGAGLANAGMQAHDRSGCRLVALVIKTALRQCDRGEGLRELSVMAGVAAES
jgi:hypothetical protein